MAASGDKLVVAAIDFGTTYSGYAFSFRHEYEKDRMNIFANTAWSASGAGLMSWKTPTTLLLQKNQTFDSFGYDAEERYDELIDNENEKGWYYFRRFKMLLHDKKVLSRDVTIPDIEGKHMPAKTVFSLSINYLKKHLMASLDKRNCGVVMDDILWVLTVPAIWNEPAKQFMREAAVMAGIKTENLILALEPEAASLYCKYLQTEKMQVGENKTEIVPFQPGTRYLVLDLGGGTVDVTVHEVIDKDTLMELDKATGGAWGGTKVDEAYMNVMKEIYGDEIMDQFTKENRPELLDFLREFEMRKRTIKDLSEEKKIVHLRFPAALHSIYEEKHSKNREEAIKQSRYVGKIKFRRDKISFDSEVFKELFRECRESIIQHIKQVLQTRSALNVSALIMVGGFSESNIITDAVREEFKDLKVIVPEEPGLSVVKGAVLYGHNPLTIAGRVCKFTYGVAVNVPFEKTVHPENKKVTINNEELCTDAFSPFVKIGDQVKAGEIISKEYEIQKQDAPVNIKIFASTGMYPLLTTEPSCNMMGSITVSPPKGGWPPGGKVVVEMGFGGTEFTVSARDSDNPDLNYTVNFDFLSEDIAQEQRENEDIIRSVQQTEIN